MDFFHDRPITVDMQEGIVIDQCFLRLTFGELCTIGYNKGMQPIIIGVLGKPLAGKDTVAQALRDQYPQIATISMGDVVREVKATGPSHRFWLDLKDSIAVADAGGIAPDEPIFRCITQLIEEQLREGKQAVAWIAGPRTEQQVGWLDSWATARGLGQKYIHIDIPDAEVYRRLDGRDQGRADDKKDIMDFRLREFERLTKPAIDQLKREGRMVEINGMGSKEDVGRRAIEMLAIRPYQPEISLPMAARR